MPNLSAFAASGVTFARHHPAYPTVTRLNAASMVTGRYPGAHGLAANTLVVHDFAPLRVIPALEPELAQVARKTPVLLSPTLADILSRRGQEYVAIGVGTSGNAYVHNPTAERAGGATIHPDFTLPSSLHAQLVARFGPWPAEARPNTARMRHAVRILTEYILPERSPAVSLIWSSEPDKSQHDAGVGSDLADLAIREADEQFGSLLRWLERTGRAADTDVLVVSDHGYSTISGPVKVEALVREAGFPPLEQPGGVGLAPNGGSVLFYIHGQDMDTAERLVGWLMAQPWCGPLTVKESLADIPGTLPASLVGNEGPRVPDVTMSFRWDSSPNGAGYVGHAYSSSGTPGLGQHGSMSRHELHNILFARGPSFRERAVIDVPSGNTDLAPTILRLLGVPGEEQMDGRVLEEALAGGPGAVPRWSEQVHGAVHSLGRRTYRQQLRLSRVGKTTYVDEGSAWLE